ncbi:hypothetical protein QR685DRAFT_568894 [Neurospora intermedia]|uniref:F-box domain-containing protein n=1 Tax=Neurospora intermedia TaxID=5142 RepID=A0ABR3DJ58_NEUIN
MEPSMSPQSTCTQPLPSPHTRLPDALELSSIWQLLPIELVQQILDHFITNLLISCRASDMYSTNTNAAILKDAWFNFRRDSLFRCQKHFIERYFYNRWLNHVRFNIYYKDPQYRPRMRYRYLHGGKYRHAHNFTGIFSPDPFRLTPHDNVLETGKATFKFVPKHRGGRASIVPTWDRLMNSTNHERLLLHIEAPDGTRKDSIELRLEGWEVSGSGARVSFPWKKLMTTVLTRILEIWAIPLPSEVGISRGSDIGRSFVTRISYCLIVLDTFSN